MATLAAIAQFAVGQPLLFTKFKAARLQVAWNVLAENGGAPTAPRKAWAIKVISNYDQDDGKEYRWFLSHSLPQAAGDAITDPNAITATASFVDAWAS